MKNETKQSPTDAIALRLADFVLRRRWWVLATTLILAITVASGVTNLVFSQNYRVFFSDENPDLVTFDKFQATYTKNDNILLVVKPEEGGVFSPETISVVENLTNDAWKIPYAIRVDSVTNFQHSWANEDDLTVEDLVRNGASLTPEVLKQKEAVALAEPLLSGNLISLDGRATGINVTLQYPEKGLDEIPAAIGYARGLATAIEAEHPDIEVAISGISAMNNAFFESTAMDAVTLFPIMFLILVVVTFLVTRTFAGTFATVMVIGLSTAFALGIAGYAGIPLSPFSASAPVIIMTLAIADSIHILITLMRQLRIGASKTTALRESMRVNFIAVTITSVTTIVGFLALNFSDAPPFQDLGNMTAIGIGAAWLFSLTFLPAAISVLPLRARKVNANRVGLESLLDRLANFVIARHRQVFAVSLAATVALTVVIPRLDLNDQWLKYFDHRLEFRTDADFALENLGGLNVVEYSVDAEDAGGVSEPEYLTQLAAFTGWLRDQPEVTHVYSYSDIAQRLNKNMHGDDEAWYRVPEDRELAAQYLLLYELSLPYGLDLNDRISIDKSATRVTATMGDISTVSVREFLVRSNAWQEANMPQYMQTNPTGATVMFSFISQRNIEDMLRGNLIAVLIIAGIMILALRHVGLGLLSLVPNVVPIVLTFGVWTLLVGQVGMSSATVSATALGIVVDDTVHFLIKYLRARREEGRSKADAIRYAYQTVGTAILANTVILVLGFGVLAFSTFKITGDLGMMTALAIGLALLVDLLFLPSLLLMGSTKQEEKIHELEPSIQTA